jgi:hypothetical protein
MDGEAFHILFAAVDGREDEGHPAVAECGGQVKVHAFVMDVQRAPT